MIWIRPAFVEINMSAEIGGYQADGDPPPPWPLPAPIRSAAVVRPPIGGPGKVASASLVIG